MGLAIGDLNGMELVISRPSSTGDRYIAARVDDATSSTIVVQEVGEASAPVYAALNGQTQGFVVYDFHTGDSTTGGAPGLTTSLTTAAWASPDSPMAPQTSRLGW